MGIVREEIRLMNPSDLTKLDIGYIKEAAVHKATVTAVVDTGAITLVIPEALRSTLGLRIVQTSKRARLANGVWCECSVTEPVEVHWKNRFTTCHAYVVPTGNVLLGAIPLEDMDLVVNMVTQRLEGANGDEAIGYMW
ncbi:aspartyl protease family protein [Breznakiellaceae bacterium SP9]